MKKYTKTELKIIDYLGNSGGYKTEKEIRKHIKRKSSVHNILNKLEDEGTLTETSGHEPNEYKLSNYGKDFYGFLKQIRI